MRHDDCDEAGVHRAGGGASLPLVPRSSVLDTCVTRDASVSGRREAVSRPLPVRRRI